jgi:hypothetical protein
VLIKVKVHPCLDLNFAGSRQKKRPLVPLAAVETHCYQASDSFGEQTKKKRDTFWNITFVNGNDEPEQTDVRMGFSRLLRGLVSRVYMCALSARQTCHLGQGK